MSIAHSGQEPDQNVTKLFAELTAAKPSGDIVSLNEDTVSAESALQAALRAKSAEATAAKPPISPDDEGAVSFAIDIDEQHLAIVLQFEHPVRWLGLELDDAMQLRRFLDERIGQLMDLKKARGNGA
jgi:hypothetical protein